MKSNWKNTIKFGFMLLALPLVATAAATAHQLMVDSTPLTLELNTPVVTTIGMDRAHTVALNRNGALEGRIASLNESSPAGDLNIYFVQNGEVVNETKTDANGKFVATGVSEGPYSFIAIGENGFAAYGVHVVSDDTGKYDNVMEAAAVSPSNDLVKQFIGDRFPAEVTNQILSSDKNSNIGLVGSNRVILNDGNLDGSVIGLFGQQSSVKGTDVHIVQNNKTVAKVEADEAGNFMVQGLSPGVYDFVAVGPTGFAAIGFEAVEPAPIERLQDTDEIDVSFAFQGFGESLDVQMIGGSDVPFFNDQVQEVYHYHYWAPTEQYAPIEYASESFGVGGAYGGTYPTANSAVSSFGSGPVGGGRGVSGFGRLALIGGLAVGIIALADDDSDAISGS